MSDGVHSTRTASIIEIMLIEAVVEEAVEQRNLCQIVDVLLIGKSIVGRQSEANKACSYHSESKSRSTVIPLIIRSKVA